MYEPRNADHFAGVGKTIQMPMGAQKSIDDMMLTRYACYLIAQNGDHAVSTILKFISENNMGLNLMDNNE